MSQWLPPRRESLLQRLNSLLRDLVSLYTPSGEERKAKEIFSRLSKETGMPLFETETGSFILGGGKVLLASHLDTVPGFIEVRGGDGWLEGRGAVDAKGPLTAMIVAGAMAWAEGKKVTVAALADEENKSAGARELIRSGAKFDHVIIGEPTGTSGIAIEYRGLIHLDIRCQSRAEHSSSSKSNLIAEMCERILKIYSAPDSYLGPTITPTIFRAGEYINVSPSSAYTHLDIRYGRGMDEGEIIKKVKETFTSCEVEVKDHVPPVAVSPNEPAVKAIMRGLLVNNIKPRLIRKTGTSDMNILAQLTRSIVTYGPGDSTMEHTESEKITLEELYIAASTYKYAVDVLCRS